MGVGMETTKGVAGSIRIQLPKEFADLLPGYVERREKDAVAIMAALDSGRLDAARDIGHRMRGSGASYGLGFVSRAGAAIEEAAIHGDRDTVRAWALDLTVCLALVEVVVEPVEDPTVNAPGGSAA